MSDQETIFALATAPGISGVAIIRLSGVCALAAAQALTGKTKLAPRMATMAAFHDVNTRAPIDRGLVLYFPGPNSFTGEDVVELHCHGGPMIIRYLLNALARLPQLRHAEAGEFTYRAFINGKMDLMMAEGLADLIDAQTEMQHSQALKQLHGETSTRYERLRQEIIQALALLEAYIDFPDEEIPESVLDQLQSTMDGLKRDIVAMLKNARQGQRIRDGIRVVILGAPNAGKSSLLNALAGRDAAIVSHVAGTTRDVIEVHMNMQGYPVILTDTAGIRQTSDEIEEEGVRRAFQKAQEADIKLVLFDITNPELNKESLVLLDEQAIAVFSKADRVSADYNPPAIHSEQCHISVQGGVGMEDMLTRLQERISLRYGNKAEHMITRERHRHLLEEALKSLEEFEITDLLELKCESLRQAAIAIGKITGKIYVDDVLDVIFTQFCIGK